MGLECSCSNGWRKLSTLLMPTDAASAASAAAPPAALLLPLRRLQGSLTQNPITNAINGEYLQQSCVTAHSTMLTTSDSNEHTAAATNMDCCEKVERCQTREALLDQRVLMALPTPSAACKSSCPPLKRINSLRLLIRELRVSLSRGLWAANLHFRQQIHVIA